MTRPRTGLAIRVLHWTVGLVISLEGYRTFHGSLARLHDLGHSGVLAWARLVLSGSELLAGVLFLVPVTAVAGGYALLAIIALAIAIHARHGDFSGLEILVLYGVAVYASLAWRKDQALPWNQRT